MVTCLGLKIQVQYSSYYVKTYKLFLCFVFKMFAYKFWANCNFCTSWGINLDLMKLADVNRISDYMEWEFYYQSNVILVILFYCKWKASLNSGFYVYMLNLNVRLFFTFMILYYRFWYNVGDFSNKMEWLPKNGKIMT